MDFLEYNHQMVRKTEVSNFINSGDFLSLRNQRILLVLPNLTNPDYYIYTKVIIEYLLNTGNSVAVMIDSSNYSKRVRKAQELLISEIQNFGKEKTKIEKFSISLPVANISEYFQNVYTIGDILEISSNFKFFSKSLHSAFCSEIALSSDPNLLIEKHRKSLVNLAQQFIATYAESKAMIAKQNPTIVMFFNGRYPAQAAVKEASEELGLPWFSIEHGSTPSKSLHIEQFQTQDRERIQGFISSWSSNLNQKDLEKIDLLVKDWLLSQQTSLKQNSFLNIKSEFKRMFMNNEQLATIFTSSLHEEISCPNWNNDNIRTLTAKTITHALELRKIGLRPIVRMHPNTGNGNWRDICILITSLRNHGVEYILPWEPISSYELADSSKVISTWRSTIGLEMLAIGRSINLLSQSHYDLVTSLAVIDERCDSITKVTEIHEMSETATLAIYYYTNYGIGIHELSQNGIINLGRETYSNILLPHLVLRSIKRRLLILSPLVFGYHATANNLKNFFQLLLGEDLGLRCMNLVLRRHLGRRF